MRLRNKVVFLTDADSASGKAVIRKLAPEGAFFILNSTSRGIELQDELALCRALGTQTWVDCVDLCASVEVEALLAKATEQLGAVDVLVHNQNVVRPVSVEACAEAEFLELLAINAKSAFITTQIAGKQMAAKGTGRIIYISSIHAEKPTGSSFVYSASKGAVQMLSREASLALGRFGVHVNHIQMGPVEGSDLVFQSEISSLYEDYRYKVPSAVLGSYDDAADLVLYLSSDESGYINGADIRVDGGFLNHYLDVRTKKP